MAKATSTVGPLDSAYHRRPSLPPYTADATIVLAIGTTA